ncbi:hypothetical protein [Amycolatopsis suaedae]|uniref:Regulatory protein n=1 Tax=Amycolatopsis suaedae TaxID=2510978 RepID=A0A4Q7J630_9PSEU|nr:hypothetical protein [Amycolatopsis suaedae]RZQ62256.1 hypothetical protein EWH70_18410 [Amycolatopsis suaedae]
MDLIIDTSGVDFQVAKPFEPRFDREGNQRRDKQGGTNLPLHAVQLVAWTKDGSETVLVTVATDNPPELTQRQSVTIEGLQAMPWVSDGRPKVAFRARAVNAVPTAATSRSGKADS